MPFDLGHNSIDGQSGSSILSPAFKQKDTPRRPTNNPSRCIVAHQHLGSFFPGLKFVLYKRDAETAQIPAVSEVDEFQ